MHAFPHAGNQQLVSDNEVAVLSHFFAKRDLIGMGYDRIEASNIIADVVEEKGGRAPLDRDFVASAPYFRQFLARTAEAPGAIPLDVYKTSSLSIVRAKARDPVITQEFGVACMEKFREIKEREGWSSDFPPPEICYNVDETG